MAAISRAEQNELSEPFSFILRPELGSVEQMS